MIEGWNASRYSVKKGEKIIKVVFSYFCYYNINKTMVVLIISSL